MEDYSKSYTLHPQLKIFGSLFPLFHAEYETSARSVAASSKERSQFHEILTIREPTHGVNSLSQT